jgi:hypothetical protein
MLLTFRGADIHKIKNDRYINKLSNKKDMDFYNNKREAHRAIERHLEDKKTLAQIEFYILRDYGFSKRFIDNYIFKKEEAIKDLKEQVKNEPKNPLEQ